MAEMNTGLVEPAQNLVSYVKLTESNFLELMMDARCGQYSWLACLCDPTIRAAHLALTRKFSAREIEVFLKAVCGCGTTTPTPAPTPVTPTSGPVQLPPIPQTATPASNPSPPAPAASPGPTCPEGLPAQGFFSGTTTA